MSEATTGRHSPRGRATVLGTASVLLVAMEAVWGLVLLSVARPGERALAVAGSAAVVAAVLYVALAAVNLSAARSPSRGASAAGVTDLLAVLAAVRLVSAAVAILLLADMTAVLSVAFLVYSVLDGVLLVLMSLGTRSLARGFRSRQTPSSPS